MASSQAAAMREQLRQWRDAAAGGPPPSLAESRAFGERLGELTAEPPGVRWHDVDAGGVPCRWADAEGGDPDRVIQYVHGGGYVIGSLDSYRRFTGHLARAVGCRVLSVGYRLAPEHPHPAPVDDSISVYRWLLAQGFAASHLAVSGDSAGGGLTLATILRIRDEGLPSPAGAVALSPWADMEATGASMRTNAEEDMIVSEAGSKAMAALFLGGADPRSPLASPLHGSYEGTAPVYLQVGADEALLDDSRRSAERIRATGGSADLEVFPEMQHVFQLAAGNMPEADDALVRIASWLRPRLGLPTA